MALPPDLPPHIQELIRETESSLRHQQAANASWLEAVKHASNLEREKAVLATLEERVTVYEEGISEFKGQLAVVKAELSREAVLRGEAKAALEELQAKRKRKKVFGSAVPKTQWRPKHDTSRKS